MTRDALDTALRRAQGRRARRPPPPPGPNTAAGVEIPRHAWPRVHDTIRAQHLPFEALQDAPAGLMALGVTRAAAEALQAAHPELALL